jgi:hypothetical protein
MPFFPAAATSLKAQPKQENKELTLVPEARIAPAGMITELQEHGWTYVRP